MRMHGIVTRRRAAIAVAAIGGIFALASCDTSDFNIRFAVGEAGTIINTTNAGASWQQQASGVQKNLNGVSFFGSTTGCAVGDNGTITYTANGTTWTPATGVPTTLPLNAVDFGFSQQGTGFPDTAWAVGLKGTIISAFAGSANACSGTWTTQTSGITANLNGVAWCRCAGQDVWAVGDYGHVLATTNGGSTWTPQTSGTGQNLEAVVFVDSQTGWAVGKRGVIIHTSNGGTTWTAQSSGTTLSLDGVAFADSMHGYAVGANGLILATIDGGVTWTPQTSHTTTFLESVSTIFAGGEGTIGDYHDAIAVGKGGVIRMTQDGGATWTTSASGTTRNLGGTS
jgi:photosystem II stability/assembly factor-like uncharacterized protein